MVTSGFTCSPSCGQVQADRLGTLQGSVTTPAGKQQQNRADATRQAPKPPHTRQPFPAPPVSHGSSAAPGRGISPARGLKSHPKALQVKKLRHRQVQRLACIIQLTSSKTREPPEPQPQVYRRYHLPLLNSQRRSCPGCIYLACSLPGTRDGAGRRDLSHSLPGDEPNANPTSRHCQSIPSSVQPSSSNAGRLA